MKRLFLSSILAVGAVQAEDVVEVARSLRYRAEAFEHGRGVRQNFDEAYRLYCESALLGDPLAAYNLGWMYFNGRGLPRNAPVAVGWFKRAAKTGDVYAARMLLRYRGIDALDDGHCQPKPIPPDQPELLPQRSARNADRGLIKHWVSKIAPSYFVDPDLVLAVIEAESGFKTSAQSVKNAQGLMQLIPATASRFGVRNTWNPEENIRGGTAYLHWLLRHFQGKVEWALAAYNAGERTVEQYQGVPPYRETQDYVRRILASYQKTVHPVPPLVAGRS